MPKYTKKFEKGDLVIMKARQLYVQKGSIGIIEEKYTGDYYQYAVEFRLYNNKDKTGRHLTGRGQLTYCPENWLSKDIDWSVYE